LKRSIPAIQTAQVPQWQNCGHSDHELPTT